MKKACFIIMLGFLVASTSAFEKKDEKPNDSAGGNNDGNGVIQRLEALEARNTELEAKNAALEANSLAQAQDIIDLYAAATALAADSAGQTQSIIGLNAEVTAAYDRMYDLESALSDMEMTPGPQGEIGPQGPVGPAGPLGTDGSSCSVSDNGMALGIGQSFAKLRCVRCVRQTCRRRCPGYLISVEAVSDSPSSKRVLKGKDPHSCKEAIGRHVEKKHKFVSNF